MTNIRNALLLAILIAVAANIVWQAIGPMLPMIVVMLVLAVGLGAVLRTWFTGRPK